MGKNQKQIRYRCRSQWGWFHLSGSYLRKCAGILLWPCYSGVSSFHPKICSQAPPLPPETAAVHRSGQSAPQLGFCLAPSFPKLCLFLKSHTATSGPLVVHHPSHLHSSELRPSADLHTWPAKGTAWQSANTLKPTEGNWQIWRDSQWRAKG